MHQGTEQLLVKVPQAAAMLGISRTKLYELISRKEIAVCRIDRSVRIPVETLQSWVKSQVTDGSNEQYVLCKSFTKKGEAEHGE